MEEKMSALPEPIEVDSEPCPQPYEPPRVQELGNVDELTSIYVSVN
jgi:hypothetical protein